MQRQPITVISKENPDNPMQVGISFTPYTAKHNSHNPCPMHGNPWSRTKRAASQPYLLPPLSVETPGLPLQVGITLRNASKGADALPVLILKPMDPSQGGALVWTSYETGLIEGPFRAEHVKRLSLTHSLAVTGKVLVAALEAFPTFSKDLQYLKVRRLRCFVEYFSICFVICALVLFFSSLPFRDSATRLGKRAIRF